MDSGVTKTLRVAGLLAAFTLSLAGCATEPVPVAYRAPGPQPAGERWTDLLQATGQAELGPGDRAYRKTWGGGENYIEVLERADGTAWTRAGGSKDLVAMRSGDLDAFHRLLDPLAFLTMDHTDPGATCLDECVETYFEAESAEGYRWVHIGPQDKAIDAAAYELQQISGARRTRALFVPAPWWTDGQSPRPADRSWIGPLRELTFSDFSDRTFNRAWRLVRFPAGEAPVVVTVTLQRGPDQMVCGPYDGRRATSPGFVFCDLDSPDEIVVWSSRTGQSVKREVYERGALEPFEQALTAGGYTTMPTEEACETPTGEPWVLEAFAWGRYRHVRGGQCDDRGLGEALAAMETAASPPRRR